MEENQKPHPEHEPEYSNLPTAGPEQKNADRQQNTARKGYYELYSTSPTE